MLTPALAELTALAECFFETRSCREGVAYQSVAVAVLCFRLLVWMGGIPGRDVG